MAKEKKRTFNGYLLLSGEILAGLCLVVFLLWVTGIFIFAGLIPKDARFDKSQKADTIVVLTGGSLRIDSGIYLLKNGAADNLFISGVGKDVTLQKLLSVSGIPAEQLSDIEKLETKIFLGFEADNTKGNAVEVGKWMKNNKYNSLYLVTASYHMPRAIIEFKRNLHGVNIIPYAVFPEDFKNSSWYFHLGSAKLMILEYNKYIASLI